jgi:hypothetical protein
MIMTEPQDALQEAYTVSFEFEEGFPNENIYAYECRLREAGRLAIITCASIALSHDLSIEEDREVHKAEVLFKGSRNFMNRMQALYKAVEYISGWLHETGSDADFATVRLIRRDPVLSVPWQFDDVTDQARIAQAQFRSRSAR